MVVSGVRIAFITCIRLHIPALRLVLEQRDHDLVEDLLMDGRILDRNQRLDPAIEVARHPVGEEI